MLIDGPYPFLGEVIWLTREQGGRKGGVPPVVEGISYAHVAHVPPSSVADGSASFVLRGWDPAMWRSSAEGRWLLAPNTQAQQVVPGSVVVITEGNRTVAFFRVDAVRASKFLNEGQPDRRSGLPDPSASRRRRP